MQLTLELTPTQGALLRALAPRGAAKTVNSLEKTALQILADGMQREIKMRRIDAGQIFAVAIDEAMQRESSRHENRAQSQRRTARVIDATCGRRSQSSIFAKFL